MSIVREVPRASFPPPVREGENAGAEEALKDLSKALMVENIDIKTENIPGYKKYANKEALKLARWSLLENNRVKASKLKRIADKMEDKYRNSKEHKENVRRNESPRWGYMCLYKNLVMSPPPGPAPRKTS